MKKQNSKKGFTLVELIIVIVIIGILAAVLIPKITSYINKAKISNDTSDCKNMNLILNTYILENGINPEELDAAEVRYIVSIDNKNYTFEPAYKNGVFYYCPTDGKIHYSTEGVTGGVSADSQTPTNPRCPEEIKENYYYLNTTGSLANALASLRGLSSQITYEQLQETHTYQGIDITNILNYFDPDETLFINANGGFTNSTITGIKYDNIPALNNKGTAETSDDEWCYIISKSVVNEVVTVNFGEAISSSNTTFTDMKTGEPVTNIVNSNITSISITDGKWIIYYTYQEGEPLETKYGKAFAVPSNSSYLPIANPSNKVKKIVFAERITVIPALYISNAVIEEGINMVLPVTVRTVMPDAFVNLQSLTPIVIKGDHQKVQFIEGSLSGAMETANSITYVKTSDIAKQIIDNACLLEFKYDDTTFKVMKNNEDKYQLYKKVGSGEWEVVNSGTYFNFDDPTISIELPITLGSKKLKIETSTLFSTFKDLDTINIDYQYKNEKGSSDPIVNATIRAFSSEGMLINLTLVYKK